LFLPFKLGSTSLNVSQFNNGKENFRIEMFIGTSNPRVLHSTIAKQLKDLVQKGDPEIVLRFEYSVGWFSSNRTLFSYQIKPSKCLYLLEKK